MKKSLCLFICALFTVMTSVACSNTIADKDKVNVGNTDMNVADNGKISIEKDKTEQKYRLSFKKTDFNIRNPYI
ncbi:hypothetical protein HMPREF0379_0390 [[Eubacterium] yurii subsp. margaretiae ATCC 43715]|nr:hypothetical protein HMPREF0379_0390 [[Eubacterium] yurii subsp. margaretiae ATCC 43715]